MLNRINAVGISDYKSVDKTIQNAAPTHQEELKETAATQLENRDVYEAEQKSDFCVDYDGKTYTSSAKLVEHLKAEQAENQVRFLRTVKDTILKQVAEISGNGIWKLIASGEYEVDPETQKAAEAAISEDGYWGVQQTSQRIVSFAKALVGSDVSRLEEMKEAFIKGFEAAEAAWGGELPAIAAQTYDAVMKLFDEWAQEGTVESKT